MHHEMAYWLQLFQQLFCDFNAVKDNSRCKAIVSMNKINKCKIANRAETLLEKISLLLLLVKDYIWNSTQNQLVNVQSCLQFLLDT